MDFFTWFSFGGLVGLTAGYIMFRRAETQAPVAREPNEYEGDFVIEHQPWAEHNPYVVYRLSDVCRDGNGFDTASKEAAFRLIDRLSR